MTLSLMRTNVRRDLHDEDAANYRWTDAVLDRHIAHAVTDFSYALPLEATSTVATTSGSRDIDIASLADRVEIEAVEYKVGNFPPTYQRFSLWKDTLTILSDALPDSSNAKIYYGKLHTLDVSSSTIPQRYTDIVALGAAAYALLEWASFAVNRVNVAGAEAVRQYRAQGNDMLDRFRKELKKLGRQNRVRVRQVYTPATTPSSKSTDWRP